MVIVGSLTLVNRITALSPGRASVGLVLSFSANPFAVSPGAPLGHKRMGNGFCADIKRGTSKVKTVASRLWYFL